MHTAAAPRDVHARFADRLAKNLGSRQYAKWFDRGARFAYNDGDRTLRIIVPNRFMADWINKHFHAELRDAAHDELGEQVKVDLQIDAAGFKSSHERTRSSGDAVHGEGKNAAPERSEGAGHIRRGRRSPALPKPVLRHRLDDFIVGPSNELAYAAAGHMTDDASQAAHPLFLHGGCGLGKTHLLQGACARVLERRPEARVHYTTGEQFTNDYIAAVRANRIDAFRRHIRSLELLAVDDVHFLANKHATQQEFLHSFDHIELGGARVMLASDCHPKLIKQFSDALISRCVRGLVVQIDRPDAGTRVTLVEALAQRRGLTLQPGVAQALADRCEGSVREIEGMLTKLHALTSLMGQRWEGRPTRHQPSMNRAIGHALVRRLFEAGAGGGATLGIRRPIRFDAILEHVSQCMGVSPQQIMGRGRHRMVVLARSLTIYLTREMTSMSYPEIAAAMNRGSHSTVITADQRVRRQLKENKLIAAPGLPPAPGEDQARLPLAELAGQLRDGITRGNGG